MSIVINGINMPKGNSTKNLLIYSDGRVFTGHKDDVNYFAEELPSAQPTLNGYNVEHLELIARVLQKENLSPERVAEMLLDIGRIVAIVWDEFTESLRRATIDAIAENSRRENV